MYNMCNVKSITPIGIKNVVDITIENNHTFVTGNGIVVHNCNSTQPALRSFIEEFSRNCGFIFTCNYKNRIIEPLHSRCAVIDFTISKKDQVKLAGQFFKRAQNILEDNSITYDKAVVAEVIQKHFPDWRRVLNELQRYSACGHIDAGMLNNILEVSIKELISMLKDKNFTGIRKWVGENLDNDQHIVFRSIYDQASTCMTKESVPAAVLIIAKYQYQAAFAVDPEINLMACLTELMIECELVK